MQLYVKRYRHGLLLIGLLLLLGNLHMIQAQSGVYYVATNGNDSNPGTESQPFRTITRGVRDLRPGQTLLVRAGLYQEELNNNIPSGDSWERPVTLRAYPGEQVIIMPAAGQRAQRVINFRSNHHIIIDGFILDGTHVIYETVKFSGNVDPNIPSPHHIRLINNEIRNAGAAQSSNGQYKAFSSGVLASGRANYIEYINNRIHSNGVTDYDHGIYHISSYALIEGNIIYNNHGSGIKVGWAQNAVDNVVRNNLIYDNNVAQGFDGQKKQGRGIGVYAGSGTLVYNNIIRGAHHSGIDVTYGGHDARIFNNTVYNTSGYGIAIGFGADTSQTARNTVVRNNIVIQRYQQIAIANLRGTNTLIENNLTFGVNTEVRQGPGGGSATINNNLVNVDPLFVNINNYDFALQASSPAIDAGANLNEVRTDFVGNTRPQGNGFDLGAFEFGQVAAPPPAPQQPPVVVTPLPTPTEPTVRVEMQTAAVQPGNPVDVRIALYNLTDVYGLQAQCQTDAAVLTGLELSADESTVFNDANSLFVDQGYQPAGGWMVAVSRIQPAGAFSGSGAAFTLRYQLQQASSAAVDCELVVVDINGHSIPAAVIGAVLNADGTTTAGAVTAPVTAPSMVIDPNEAIEPLATPEVVVDSVGTITGQLRYQGRADSAGISVQLLQDTTVIAETTTDASGAYQFSELAAGNYLVQASAARYLPSARPALLDAPEQALDLGAATLLAGDVDSNTLIDIVDASLVGANFGLEAGLFPDADLNVDGIINIADLVLVGGNFGLNGAQ